MHDPFGRSALPADFSREGRVRLIAEVAEALLAGRLPGAAARLFVGGALQAWLREGGRCGALEREYLRVAAPRSSRHTASELWRRCSSSRGTTRDDGEGSIESSTTGTPTTGATDAD